MCYTQSNYKRSSQRWSKKLKKLKAGEIYTVKDHMDWCADNNFGVSHFGLKPEDFPRSNIRFDVFHMWSSITKTLMSRLRLFIRDQMPDLMERFSTVLKTFWGNCNVQVWENNKDFSNFKGDEIKSFVDNIEHINVFLDKAFETTNHLKNVMACLKLWQDINKFLSITKTGNEEDYKRAVDKFHENVKQFYIKGKDVFLTRCVTGDAETFYLHTPCQNKWLRHHLKSMPPDDAFKAL